MNPDFLYNGNPANNAYAARLCEEGRINELMEFCTQENHRLDIDVLLFNAPLYTIIKCKNCIELRLRTHSGMVDKLLATFPKQSLNDKH